MKNIIISGASGFIGSQFINHIINQNKQIKIYAIINKNKNFTHKNARLKIFKLDLTKKINKSLFPKKIDCIFHLAGIRQTYLTDVNASNQIKNNYLMTFNLLELARCLKVKNFIFSSSVYVYSGSKEKKFKENIFINPKESLGISKYMSEKLIEYYSNHYQIKSIIFRLSTTYGKNSSSSQFIPIILKKILNSSSKVYFDKLGFKRDFIYIADVSNILYESIKRIKNMKKQLLTLNLSYGVSINTRDLIIKIANLLHFNTDNLVLKSALSKKNDFDHIVPNTKLKNFFIYKPRYSIDKGLSSLIQDE